MTERIELIIGKREQHICSATKIHDYGFLSQNQLELWFWHKGFQACIMKNSKLGQRVIKMMTEGSTPEKVEAVILHALVKKLTPVQLDRYFQNIARDAFEKGWRKKECQVASLLHEMTNSRLPDLTKGKNKL